MVEHQLRDRGVTDERVLAAMGAIPREAFVPDASRRNAYADGALPIESGQTISQPLMVAKMTERLEVQPGDRILEIGTGSGYQAAILAWLGADVTSLERQAALIPLARERLEALAPDLAGSVEVREADGSLGDADGAPWDGIIVTAAAPAVPQELRDQLADGGRLVIPVGSRDRQLLTVVTRHGDEWLEQTDGYCVFVPLIGPGGFDGLSARRPAGAARYTRPAMTHVFVAPHPDDVALSCGGLIASLRELGQNVTILTVFSGDGSADRLTPYQREALGFGSKALWPNTEAFNRLRHRRPTGRPPRSSPPGPRPRTGSRRRRPTPTPRPSASGSARRGTAGRASATNRSRSSRSSTTCRRRAPSTPTRSSMPRSPAT